MPYSLNNTVSEFNESMKIAVLEMVQPSLGGLNDAALRASVTIPVRREINEGVLIAIYIRLKQSMDNFYLKLVFE